MKQLCTYLLLIALAQGGFAQLSGPLSGTLGPGEFHVVDTIYINEGDSLRLMPGTTFLFNWFPFNIYGTLLAEGTETDSIIFTATVDSLPRRAWGGLLFYPSSGSGSRLSYCLIELAHNWDGGGIRCMQSSPTFEHCTIRENWAYGDGGGVFCTDSSTPTFLNCDIRDNSAFGEWFWGFGGGISCDQSTLTLIGCRICDNGASWSSGGIECSESSLTLTNCVISGNFTEAGQGGSGLSLWGTSCSLTNCTFSDNGGYHSSETISCSSSLIFKNSIIASSNGPGIRFYQTDSIRVEYCDFVGNSGGDFAGSLPDGLGLITTTNANGDPCDRYFNIFSDPMFFNAAEHDYHLSDGSRCIGAGDTENSPDTDIEGNPRPDPPESNPDIGAFENAHGVPLDVPFSNPFLPTKHALYPNYPNPFNPTT
ncbi:right-handed parallel beta-helix repeat-containing protein, partial [bacterium]|nr:right-handed parallel beta-helix repeat-containing protein [bacterium]